MKEETESRKIIIEWQKNFVKAIKGKDFIKLENLLDESDEYFQGRVLLPNVNSNIILNDQTLTNKDKSTKILELQKKESERIKQNILQQSRSNVKNILDLIYSDCENFIDNLSDNNIYANATFTKICETPILLSILCPFELSGIIIICLLHNEEELKKFKVPPALLEETSIYCLTSKMPIEYKLGIFFGNSKDSKTNYSYKLNDLLHINTSDWYTSKNKENSDVWKLLEICYYVDRSCYKQMPKKDEDETQEKKVKKHDIKPLFHIIDENKHYMQTLSEITKGFNPYSIKYLIFKTLVFYNAFTSEKYLNITTNVVTLYAQDNAVLDMLNICWFMPYMKPEIKDFDDIIKQVKQQHKEFLKSLEISLKKYEEEIPKCNIFIECLWKLILHDMICFRQVRNEYMLKFLRKYDNKEQLEAISNIMLPQGKNLVHINDWNSFYGKYEINLKRIFNNLEEHDLKKLWQIACKNELFINSNSYNFDFDKNRLNKNRIRKVDSNEYEDNEVEAISLVWLMEIANIDKEIEDAGSYIFPLKRFNKNFKNFTIKKVMANMQRYSSDPIILWLREIIALKNLTCILPNEEITLFFKAYNKILEKYKEVFETKRSMKQSLDAILTYLLEVNKLELEMLSCLVPEVTKTTTYYQLDAKKQ